MKILRIMLGFLVIVLLGTSIWTNIKLAKCRRLNKMRQLENTQKEEVYMKLKDAFMNSQMISMKHLGKELLWTNLKRIYPGKNSQLEMKKNPKLVLIFSEFGCSVCQDNETHFAVEFAEETGINFVLAVVHAGNERYVRNYIRINQVNFPVYFCEDDKFLHLNNLRNTPMIFVIDEEDRIIASHFPLPGHPEYSEPIHQFCYHYFEQFKKKFLK